MKFYLRHDLYPFFPSTSDYFTQIMSLRGISFRNQEGRLTQQITLDNKNYFIKQHKGVGWGEIFKNMMQLRWPVLSAKNEWLAIQKLHDLGIAVPVVAGFGKQGVNPAAFQSFILTEALTSTISLEMLCKDWQLLSPAFALKRLLIEEVARIASVMHESGINHRDFYLCHFLLDVSGDIDPLNKDNLKLYLIDLHRAQIRKTTPFRWRVKDLSGLYFSSKEIGLTRRDLYRFMKRYRKKSLREIINDEGYFWQKVKIRGERLYREHCSS